MSRPLLARGLVRVGAGIGDGDVLRREGDIVVVVFGEGWDGDCDLENKGWAAKVRILINICGFFREGRGKGGVFFFLMMIEGV